MLLTYPDLKARHLSTQVKLIQNFLEIDSPCIDGWRVFQEVNR
jgi:hypothetical protein